MKTDWDLVQAGDQDTIEALLHRHEPLVLNIVGRFTKPNLNCFDDLKQVGMIALWRAIKEFDPARGFAFSTLAYPYIRNAVFNEARTGGVIRVPKPHRADNEHSKRLKEKARSVGSLSDPHGVCQDVFFAKTPDPAERLENQEEYYRSMARYHQRMDALRPRERLVVRARLNGATFPAIGRDLGVSGTRAHQLWDRALKKLREDSRTVREHQRRPLYDKQARYRDRKRRAGLCIRCGKKPEQFQLCDECRQKVKVLNCRSLERKPT